MKKKLIGMYVISIVLYLLAFYMIIWQPENRGALEFTMAGLISMAILSHMIEEHKTLSKKITKDKIIFTITVAIMIFSLPMLNRFPVGIHSIATLGLWIIVYIYFGYKIYKKLQEETNESEDVEK